MNKFTFSVLTFILLFIATTNIGSFKVKAANFDVGMDEAIKVTHNFIANSDNRSIWYDYNLVFKHEVYDIDDTVLGYYFTIEKDGKYLGYIITSATKEREPILQYGEGIFYEGSIPKSEKYYFINPFYKVTAENQKDLSIKFKAKKDSAINSLKAKSTDSEQVLTEIKKLENTELVSLKKDVKGAAKLWESLLNQTTNNISTFAYTEGTKLPVTRVWQRTPGVTSPNTACGPTVGVMINNYYNSLGYWVKKSADYGGHAAFINRMDTLMNTGVIGTTASDFRDGVRKQLNTNWDTWQFSASILQAQGYYETYKSYIRKGYPVALRFNNIFEFGGKSYSWHFVLGVGYTGSYAMMLNPDGGQTNTGTHKILWSLYDQDMSMIFTQPNNPI